MTKIAFFDVDGTMINVPHQLLKPTDKTIRALKEFQKQGNYIVVASARGAMPDCLKEIPFDGFIGCDGGYIEFHQEVLLNNIFGQGRQCRRCGHLRPGNVPEQPAPLLDA